MDHASTETLPAAEPESPAADLAALASQLEQLRAQMLAHAAEARDLLDAIPAPQQASAENLLHYVALRRHDLRELQGSLAQLGLSSLGHGEAHALANVEAVLSIVRRLLQTPDLTPAERTPLDLARGNGLLTDHACALLGDEPDDRGVRIMVTMPSEAASDAPLVRDLLESGMDVMRINCAHDHADAWQQMIAHLRAAEEATGRSCRVAMDLAGPKLRTGQLAPGPEVVKIRPERDRLGRVTTPAKVWLYPADEPLPPPGPAAACLPVVGRWLNNVSPGDRLRFRDARERARSLRVTAAAGSGRWAECKRTAYITSDTTLKLKARAGDNLRKLKLGEGTIGALPATEEPLALKVGDRLTLGGLYLQSRPARLGPTGETLEPAVIGSTLGEALADVAAGERILLDDGAITGVIRDVQSDRIQIEITQSRLQGEKLRGDKGINLPDSHLRLAALTSKDLADLEFVAAHADIVSYSFVRSATDVEALYRELVRLGADELGVILKIETRQAFENLPSILLAGLARPRLGVMIARGDLAVECGYVRLAELQEEVLWLCEAAHAPVIWATQVLETLAKTGRPSRAEITDAAMGQRAECVMLNKGPFICEAVRLLDDILSRMDHHQSKKRSMLRQLRVAGKFDAGEEAVGPQEGDQALGHVVDKRHGDISPTSAPRVL